MSDRYFKRSEETKAAAARLEGNLKKSRLDASADEKVEDRLEDLIAKLGDEHSALQGHLDKLSQILLHDIADYKTHIFRVLLDCITSMPEKLTCYSTLIALMNARKYTIGGEFVEFLVKRLRKTLRENLFTESKILVCFLADLVNCLVIKPSSMISIFENFIDVTLTTEENVPQTRSDWYVFMVLSTLPYSGKTLNEKTEKEFKNLLQTIDRYLQRRNKDHVDILRVWIKAPKEEGVPEQEDYLDSLWLQLKGLAANRWNETIIFRPYSMFMDVLGDQLQHQLPQIMLPSHTEVNYPLPRVIFRLFDPSEVTEGPPLPGAYSIERYIAEEQLGFIIDSWNHDRKLIATHLLNALPHIALPKPYLIVEVMFGQLFALPSAPYLEIFYGCAFLELCRQAPQLMPQVLAQAVEALFERLDYMKIAVVTRFCSWFAYHLSQFEYKWSWAVWFEDLETDGVFIVSRETKPATVKVVDVLHPKVVFLRQLLLRTLRLSFYQRIADTVCSDDVPFQCVLPPMPEFKFKFGPPMEPGTPVSATGSIAPNAILKMLQTKQINSADQAQDALARLLTRDALPGGEDGGADGDSTLSTAITPAKIEVFFTCLLHVGQKTFSHTFTGLAKFYHLLQKFSETEQGQTVLLQTIFDCWQTHEQMMVVIVDKMLKAHMVQHATVANWLFSPEMHSELVSFYVWEILHSTVFGMSKRIDKSSREIDEKRYSLEENRKVNPHMALDNYEKELVGLEEQLGKLQAEQKELILIVCQKLIYLLSDDTAASSTEHQSPYFKRIMFERLEEFLLLHQGDVQKYHSTLQTLLFNSSTDNSVLKVYQRFSALFM